MSPSQDFKETFITEISSYIGAIKNILENIQNSIYNLPNVQYYENWKDKIEVINKNLDKLHNDIYNHSTITITHIEQTNSNNALLHDIRSDLTQLLSWMKESKLDQLIADQDAVQKKLLDPNSDCNKVNTICLKKNKELENILIVLSNEGLTINDFTDWVKYVKRTNAFYNEFTGWKKSLIIIGGFIVFFLYFFRDITSIIKSLAPLVK